MHWINRYAFALATRLLEHHAGNRQAMAQDVNITASRISLLLNGHTNRISIGTVIKLEEAFDRSLAPEVRENLTEISENDL